MERDPSTALGMTNAAWDENIISKKAVGHDINTTYIPNQRGGLIAKRTHFHRLLRVFLHHN
jgi:hypothetical protein